MGRGRSVDRTLVRDCCGLFERSVRALVGYEDVARVRPVRWGGRAPLIWARTYVPCVGLLESFAYIRALG